MPYKIIRVKKALETKHEISIERPSHFKQILLFSIKQKQLPISLIFMLRNTCRK